MWELVSFARGQVRRICLEALASGPKTPTSIAKSSKEHLPHISRALKELAEKGLVECLTPDLPKNRIYRITDRGKEVLEKLREMG
jgi:DNA-binding PadR family transcriptional regulator